MSLSHRHPQRFLHPRKFSLALPPYPFHFRRSPRERASPDYRGELTNPFSQHAKGHHAQPRPERPLSSTCACEYPLRESRTTVIEESMPPDTTTAEEAVSSPVSEENHHTRRLNDASHLSEWLKDEYARRNSAYTSSARDYYASRATHPLVFRGFESLPFAPLSPRFSAIQTVSRGQWITLLALVAAQVAALYLLGTATLNALLALITLA